MVNHGSRWEDVSLVNTLYHSAVVSSFSYWLLTSGAQPKLDLTPCDTGMLIASVAHAMATKDTLIKQGIIPMK